MAKAHSAKKGLMKLVLTDEARENMASIHAYIARDSPAAAREQIRRIASSLNSLRAFPKRSRNGRVEGTWELVIPRTPYIAVLRPRNRNIEVISIRHGARRWPMEFPVSGKKPPQKIDRVN